MCLKAAEGPETGTSVTPVMMWSHRCCLSCPVRCSVQLCWKWPALIARTPQSLSPCAVNPPCLNLRCRDKSRAHSLSLPDWHESSLLFAMRRWCHAVLVRSTFGFFYVTNKTTCRVLASRVLDIPKTSRGNIASNATIAVSKPLSEGFETRKFAIHLLLQTHYSVC